MTGFQHGVSAAMAAADIPIVLENFVQPGGSRQVSCQNAGGCTATWSLFQNGVCSACPRWYNPTQAPQRTWHFRWRLSGCTQGQGVPMNVWTLMTQTYGFSESCSNPQISNCGVTIDLSHDGGSTVAGTFTASAFCDASP